MLTYTDITSADNEKIRLYKRLAADKKIRRRERLFTAEGARLIADAAGEAIELRCVFFTDSASDKYSDALELLSDYCKGKNLYRITDSLARTLSQTQMPQGLFAVCKMPCMKSAEQLCSEGRIRKKGRYLILDCIQDPGNMGTILRTADACGIDAVFACGCCDIYNPKTVRSAMGSIMRICVCETEIDQIVSCFKSKSIPVFAAVTDSNAISLTECDFSGGGAVMIGNEGSGLSEEHAGLADTQMTIKMHGTINSLNAAMAAGIIVWELSK